MADYNINKGIGSKVEFKGLKSQYLYLFAGGLLSIFVLFVIMYMAGVSQTFCIVFSIVLATVLVWFTFYLNGKFGEYGLMKLYAKSQHPKRIYNRRNIKKLIKK